MGSWAEVEDSFISICRFTEMEIKSGKEEQGFKSISKTKQKLSKSEEAEGNIMFLSARK